jgi:hypothetical protein
MDFNLTPITATNQPAWQTTKTTIHSAVAAHSDDTNRCDRQAWHTACIQEKP